MATLSGDTTFAPATVVDALPVAPPLVSLLSSAIVSEETDERHWATGIVHEQDQKGLPANPYWWVCHEAGGAAPGYDKGTGTGEDLVRFRPFDVYHGFSCSANQPIPLAEREARARRLLASVLSAAIERELWTGTVATTAGFPNDYLENAPTDLGDFGPRRGLAELEQAAATVQAGAPAMIHAQPRLVTAWAAAGLVTPTASGRQLRTAMGTLVVPGAGYPGSGPDGTPGATHSWAYITGLVRVWLGPVRVTGLGPSELDTSVNDRVVRAERAVVYSFDDALKHAVYIDLQTSATDF